MGASDADSTAGRLDAECGTIAWHELARHFARGVVLRAAPDADLIHVAERVVADDVDDVRRMLDSGALARASDDDARAWVACDARFRCVVVAPWVMVQELAPADDP